MAPRAEYVLGNPLIIEQIFVNLLLNAVEASAVLHPAVLSFQKTIQRMQPASGNPPAGPGVVLPYAAPARKTASYRAAGVRQTERVAAAR